MIDVDNFADLRAEVNKLCTAFPGEYWRGLDREAAYPAEFVNTLTDCRLSGGIDPRGVWRLGPAAVRRSRYSGGDTARGLQRRRLPRADVHHGHAAAARQRGRRSSASCRRSPRGELRLQAFGVTEPTTRHRHHRAQDHGRARGRPYVVNGQKIWTSRAEHSDLMLLLARTTPRDQVKQAHRRAVASSSSTCAGRGGNGLTIRPIRDHDEPRHHRGVLRRSGVPAENLIGEEGKGFRYILDGMNAERILIAAECIGDARWFIDKAADYAKERVVFGRPIGQNQGMQFPIARAYAQMRGRRPDGAARPPRLFEAGQPCGAEANMAKHAGGRGLLGGGQRLRCRPMAASASPRNTTSSANSARRGCTRWRRSRPT